MVSDGGGRFIPAGMVGSHKLSLLLESLVAHDHATEDNDTHDTRKERNDHRTQRPILSVGAVHNPRQGGINFFPL